MSILNKGVTFATGEQVTSTRLNNLVDQATFAANAVDDATIRLSSGQLAVKTIQTSNIATSAITESRIANNAVTTSKINDLDVSTAKIANSAITTAKIADANVTTAKVADAAITAPKLDGAQTGSAPIFGARAWVNFDADRDESGATTTANTNRFIRASGNVASVLKTAQGRYTVTFTTALPDANYAVIGTSGGDNNPRWLGSNSSNQTTTEFLIRTHDSSGNLTNFANNTLVVFG